MFDPRSISVITLSAALCLSADRVQAFDDATYPDLKGQWIRITPPGQPGIRPEQAAGPSARNPADTGISGHLRGQSCGLGRRR